jgi:glycosyltransferase involved in cell wall biosynthesis
MKICVVSSTVLEVPLSGYGGLESVAYLCAEGLARRGHEVMLVAPGNSIPPPGVELHRTTVGESEMAAYSGYWHKLPSFDVIIDHSWQKFSYILKVEGKLKAPILGVCHAPISTMYQSAPPVLFPCLVAISQDQADHISEHLGVPARVAYNGIDLNFYRAKEGVTRSERYLFLARMSRIKGPHLAVDVARKMRIGLDLVGDDRITGEPQLAQRMRMAAQHNITYHGGVSRERAVEFFSAGKALLHMNQHFCLVPGQPVVTAEGVQNVEAVSVADRVLSSDGKFHPVTSVMTREYSGSIVEIQHTSTNAKVRVTPDHPLLVVSPKKCGCGHIDGACRPTYGCVEWCRAQTAESVVAKTKYEMVMRLVSEGVRHKDILKQTGVPETTISYWKSGRSRPRERDSEMPYCDTYKAEWKPASEIKEGDYLVTPVPVSASVMSKVSVDLTSYWPEQKGLLGALGDLTGTMQVTDDFLRLCGLYIAEGSTNNGSLVFSLHENETYLVDWIKSYAERTLSRAATVFHRPLQHCQQVRISARPLDKIFESWFGHTARNKRMPEWVFTLPPEQLRHVVKGMWHGDGCNTKRGAYEMLSYTTSSRTLAHQLWLCLLKLGVMCYVVEKKASAKAFNAGRTMFNLNVCGDSANLLSGIVDIDISDNRGPNAWHGFSFIHRDTAYSKVQSIETFDYKGTVHNLTVEDSHSFVSQLISSHNCEPFGLAPVEANACGLPVICFDNGAMRETIVHGETGFLVKSVAEVEDLIRTNAVAGIKADACRKNAERFSTKAMVDAYEALAKEAVEGGGW